ncbi:MAG TPA: dienelactone hydrolase family protein [Tepidisphaeraceae bacterium]|nr:dienelactone hydrolase family protein [Tepidisphaeraceae bacterium]
MNHKLPLALLALLVTFPSFAADMLPPGEKDAKARLNSSSRHGEMVDVQVPGAVTKVRSYVVFPERKEKAPVVIVIQEIFGLSDWIRSVADQLAADGFIAIAPDLLSGKGPRGGGTESFTDRDAVMQAVRALKPDDVDKLLNAVRDHAVKLPAASGKYATVGYCWGGMTSFRYATVDPNLSAAVVYYGTSPATDTLAKIKAPVLGLYGEIDERVNATIPDAEAKMKELGKTYVVKKFTGAGHGFLRQQDGKEGANLKAAQEAWPETVKFLKENTK